MDRARRKDFNRLYEVFVDQIFRYFSIRVSDREKAKDMTQETFIRFWNSYYSQGRKIDNERALLFTIAHSILVNSYQRDKSHISIDLMKQEGQEIVDEGSEDIISKIDNENLISDVKKNIENLNPKYRQALFLRFIENMSVTEIAKILDESENVVSVRIFRGLKKLKGLYGRQ